MPSKSKTAAAAAAAAAPATTRPSRAPSTSKPSKPPPPSELDQWLSAHSSEYTVLPSGKLHCHLTATDLPLSLPLLIAHWSGPAYRRASLNARPLDLSLYPYVVPHRSLPSKVYCTLTRQVLNARGGEVEMHVRGVRYLRAKRRWEQREKEREERERRRREKKDSGKDDDVEARLPPELLDQEDEEEEMEEEEEEEEGEDGQSEGEGEGNEEEVRDSDDAMDEEEEEDEGERRGGRRGVVREVDEDEGMPVVRKRAITSLKRRREREVEADEGEKEEEERQPVPPRRPAAARGRRDQATTNGHAVVNGGAKKAQPREVEEKNVGEGVAARGRKRQRKVDGKRGQAEDEELDEEEEKEGHQRQPDKKKGRAEAPPSSGGRSVGSAVRRKKAAPSA